MLFYRIGRLLQVLALIDCAFALFLPSLIPKMGGMDPQFQIVLLAGALFAVGRFLQKRGEASLRAAGKIPSLEAAEVTSSPTRDGGGGNP
jgi:hypothetical protein